MCEMVEKNRFVARWQVDLVYSLVWVLAMSVGLVIFAFLMIGESRVLLLHYGVIAVLFIGFLLFSAGRTTVIFYRDYLGLNCTSGRYLVPWRAIKQVKLSQDWVVIFVESNESSLTKERIEFSLKGFKTDDRQAIKNGIVQYIGR